MANFKEAFDKTMIYEGGYANDPADRGGETYRGISRKNFPNWSGWTLIDQIKKDNPKNFKKIINNLVNSNEQITEAVESFYKVNFWDVFRGDDISSQRLANLIFDAGVNSGTRRPIKWLQAALNDIIGSKLSVDGVYGNNTHNIVLRSIDKAEELVSDINRQRKNFYNDIVNRNPSQKKFLKGWMRRVEEFK